MIARPEYHRAMTGQEPIDPSPPAAGQIAGVAVALWLAFSACYGWTAPSLAYQHWDSLEYAHVVESLRVEAVWGNHPLGHLVQQGTYRGARAMGYTGRAMPLLQALGAVVTAGAIAWFFVLLATTLGLGRMRAAGWAVLLGSTWGLAHYAGTADIYGLALLTLVLGWHGLTSLAAVPSVRRALGAGVLIGIAGLTHQFAVVVIAAAAAAFVRRLGVRYAAWLAAATGMTLVAGYVGIAWLVTANDTPSEIIRWIRGYGSDPTYGQFFTPIGAVMGIASLAQTVLGWTASAILSVVRYALLALAVVLFAGLLPADGDRPAFHRHLTRAALAACVVGWLLIVWWEPGNRKFWLLTLPGVVLVMAGRRPRASSPSTAVFPMLLGVVWLVFNLSAGLRYEHRPNVAFEDGLEAWMAHTAPDDLIFENSDFTAHLLLWAERPHTANIYRLLQGSPDPEDPYAGVRALIETAWTEGRDVLFAEGLSPYYSDMRLEVVGTTRAELAAFFDGYRREGPVFEYRASEREDFTRVYRLTRP